MVRGVGGVRKSIHQRWLAKGLGLGLLCWDFKGVQKEIPSEEACTLQIGQWHFHQDNTPVHNSILVTDYLTKMSIKTVPQPPYSPDLGPCNFCLFPKLRGFRYETIEELKRVCDEGHWHAHTRGLPWGLPEVVGTVQVHRSRKRLLWRKLEFHAYTINKRAHTEKKSGNLFNDPRKLNFHICWLIYILKLLFKQAFEKMCRLYRIIFCISNFKIFSLTTIQNIK